MTTAPPPISLVWTPDRLSPTRVADGTYLVHQVVDIAPLPICSYGNAAVIQAEQPILVDTGSARNSAEWLRDVFSLVDPAELGWVFVSHADADHAGNLGAVLDACPNARVVCQSHLAEIVPSIVTRNPVLWPAGSPDGITFDAGDREMILIRPPRYDSPSTMGLLDTKTGAYWSADSFGGFVPCGDGDDLPRHVSEFDDGGERWNASAAVRARMESPWLTLVDDHRYADDVQRILDLDISLILSAHGPAITGDQVAQTLARLPGLPGECRSAPSLSEYIERLHASA